VRVLVTGHKGYLGTVLVPALLDAGHVVTGLDTGFFEEAIFAGRVPAIPELRRDVRDVEAADLDGFQAVVHLAGLSNDPLGDLDAALTDAINHAAAVRLAECAKAAGVARFLFSSTCSVYGEAGEEVVHEASPLRPLTAYARSKMLAEEGLAALADDQFTPTFLRHGTAYGVSPRMRFDLVLNNLVAWACATGRIHFKSDGLAWRPLVHVRDIAQAFLWAITAPHDVIRAQAFNVGVSEENYRIRDLGAIVRALLPSCEIEMAANAQADRRSYRVDCSKLKRVAPELRFAWTVHRGAVELVEACRGLGASPDQFEGRRYSRVARLLDLQATGRLDSRLRWRVPEGARPVEWNSTS
jgi:nucleoside-diphosphate-sugar epimerase